MSDYLNPYGLDAALEYAIDMPRLQERSDQRQEREATKVTALERRPVPTRTALQRCSSTAQAG
jgi:hypothetical protein